MKLFFSTLFFITTATALAGYSGDYFPHWNTKQSSRYENLNDFQRAGDPDADVGCTNFYQKINQSRHQKIILGVGYTDEMPSNVVRDPMMIDALTSKLMAPCSKDVKTLCGFQRLPMEGAILLRKFVKDAHDYSQRSVDIVVIGRAMSVDNNLNTGANKDIQLALCRQNEELFHSQIKSGADSVFYFGHSRNGGGPDFCPPVVRADGHVNYDYYKARRAGITGLVEALSEARKLGNEPSLVGMFSCSSQHHFKARLSQAAPEAGLLLSGDGLGFDYMYRNLLTVISGQINQTCYEPLQWSLNTDSSYNHYKLLQFYNFMK